MKYLVGVANCFYTYYIIIWIMLSGGVWSAEVSSGDECDA